MTTRYRSYEFLVMAFKFINSLATFIFIMNLVFHKELDECLVVYNDDILVYFLTEVDHAQSLEKVLSK